VDEALRVFNGAVGDPHSFDRLDNLLNEQAFRPAYWRVAAEEINYRRFFDINQLAAIRVEEPPVLEHTHQVVFRLLGEGKVSGLRVDHPDGLWDPTAYFYSLQERYALQRAQERLDTDGARESLARSIREWFAQEVAEGQEGRPHWPLYVLAEKILGENEQMGDNWPIYGTTGYDFLNAVAGLFVDERNGPAFERLYSQFIQRDTNYASLVNSSKKMIMLVSLASELNALSHMIERLSERNRRYRDFTRNSLTFALREIIAGLPVYRTYVTGKNGGPSERDVTHIQAAVAEAKRRNPRTAETIFDFLSDTLLLRNLYQFNEEDRPGIINFVMKLQQVTGPVAAKGVEDTAFYVYNRLTSLNEVGGNPQRFGNSLGAFHRANEERLARWPHAMLATSTHDTKRSEDVRARISVLSELPTEWRAALGRWSDLNAAKKGTADGQPAPSRNDEYLLYQTLLGAWPEAEPGEPGYAGFRERITAYLLKAVKEAKVHTSWVNANEAYDGAVEAFVRRLLVDDPADPFLADFRQLQRRVAFFGQFNALSQLLLKLTSPGVPDVYRGTELWDFSLVDPDNRRPVDYDRYRHALAQLRGAIHRAGEDLAPLAGELFASSQTGLVKMYVLYRTLGLRRAEPRLFEAGRYRPLRSTGLQQAHVCAFARVLGDQEVLAVTPRLVVGLTGGEERPPLGADAWGDTWLMLPEESASARYRNLFTGQELALGEHGRRLGLPLSRVLETFPVALLERVR
jgi:(1->4)-alpha-D-glucan 1-alpha-D-glucosylmutase